MRRGRKTSIHMISYEEQADFMGFCFKQTQKNRNGGGGGLNLTPGSVLIFCKCVFFCFFFQIVVNHFPSHTRKNNWPEPKQFKKRIFPNRLSGSAPSPPIIGRDPHRARSGSPARASVWARKCTMIWPKLGKQAKWSKHDIYRITRRNRVPLWKEEPAQPVHREETVYRLGCQKIARRDIYI